MLAQRMDNARVDAGHGGAAEIHRDTIGLQVLQCGAESFSAGHTFGQYHRADMLATMRGIFFGVIALVCSLSAPAQPPKMDTILYGASYYHEYMPAERLDKDIDLKKRAGLRAVRLGGPTQRH